MSEGKRRNTSSALMSAGQASTSGSSPSRAPPACIECLHELLASSKRLRGNAILPHEQVVRVIQHCAGVQERLEERCKHRQQQAGENGSHGGSSDGSVELKHVLCPRHSGLINEALGLDLLRICFRNLGAQDLCRCASVCKLWRKVASMDELWKRLLNELPCKNFLSLDDSSNTPDALPPKLRYILYRNGSQWDDRFGGKYIVDSGHPATPSSLVQVGGETRDGAVDGDDVDETVVEFHEKRRTVVVSSSSGSKLYQLIQNTSIDLDHRSRRRARKRFMVRACPSLCKGSGKWTVHLKRLCSSAVNAVGLAAKWKRKNSANNNNHTREEGEEEAMTLTWLFNTDGSDCPLVKTNIERTAVETYRWHGFGDVVAPNFWRIMFDMEEDRLVLDCGMRKEVQGCPLLEKKGLLKQLREMVKSQQKDQDIEDTQCITVQLVLLLESSKATLIDCCDATV